MSHLRYGPASPPIIGTHKSARRPLWRYNGQHSQAVQFRGVFGQQRNCRGLGPPVLHFSIRNRSRVAPRMGLTWIGTDGIDPRLTGHAHGDQ